MLISSPAAFVFPVPASALMCVSFLGRILHQTGYAIVYGKYDVGSQVTEGLILIVIAKAFNLFLVLSTYKS